MDDVMCAAPSRLKVWIMQGASGSGKSTKAAEIALKHDAVVCSTDSYFIVPSKPVVDPSDGHITWTEPTYDFRPEMLGKYHRLNQRRAAIKLSRGISVVIDNTNLKPKFVRPYILAAKLYGAEIIVVRCDGQYQNVHGVPEDKVASMRASVQDLTPLVNQPLAEMLAEDRAARLRAIEKHESKEGGAASVAEIPSDLSEEEVKDLAFAAFEMLEGYQLTPYRVVCQTLRSLGYSEGAVHATKPPYIPFVRKAHTRITIEPQDTQYVGNYKRLFEDMLMNEYGRQGVLEALYNALATDYANHAAEVEERF